MTRFLLIGCALAACCGTGAMAQNKSYYSEFLGEVNGVSDNGRFVAIGDIENNTAYLWSADNPDVFQDITPDAAETSELPSAQRITGALAYDATDDGKVVGTLFFADGHSVGAVYADGKWTVLPLHPAALNTNEAVAVTPDGKTILGFQFISDKTSAIAGRYYPVHYTLNDKGSYDLHAYTDIELPDHQGFYPMTQTADGKVIGGMLFCAKQSIIPALVVNGELKYFHELTTVAEPWYFEGKGYYCGFDENKKQIWTDDPEDPRIQLFYEYYIDGYHDAGESDIEGYFSSCDANGNFYGRRSVISDVDEEGNGTVKSGACVYNVNTDTWTMDYKRSFYSTGIGTDLLFSDNGTMIVNGTEKDFTDEYDMIIPEGRNMSGVSKISANGKVFGGMLYEYNEATGQYQYLPFVTVADGAYSSGTGNVTFGGNGRPSFLVSGGRITLRNGESMTVYDTNGHKVATGKTAAVAPGVYIVKSGEVSAKVLVR